MIWRENEGDFWDTGNILYLVMRGDYMNICIYKSLPRCILKIAHFTIGMLYFNAKNKIKNYYPIFRLILMEYMSKLQCKMEINNIL